MGSSECEEHAAERKSFSQSGKGFKDETGDRLEEAELNLCRVEEVNVASFYQFKSEMGEIGPVINWWFLQGAAPPSLQDI